MIVQTVLFETSMTHDELLACAHERSDFYRNVAGLIHKYYCAGEAPNTYSGIMVWESREAMQAYLQSETAQTIGEAYKVVGAPRVEFLECLFELDGPAAGALAAA